MEIICQLQILRVKNVGGLKFETDDEGRAVSLKMLNLQFCSK